MRNKKFKVFLALLILCAGIAFLIIKAGSFESRSETMREIGPSRETIRSFVSTTAAVLPKNRLEVKSPVNGRIESILVKEGEIVKAGQTLAWMSSTERAALLDAARGRGEKELAYWQEAYKPIPLISPIDGEVIVATTQPGQTVTTADAVIVLSDTLIVRAVVDEVDIGKIKLGQVASISLDAYPEEKIKAIVEHIYYESKTMNNVTMYEVDLRTERVPEFFRSGMNASVNFIVNSKEGALVVPAEAVLSEKEENFVLVKDSRGAGVIKRSVTLGISEDKKVEILSGLKIDDTLVIKSKKYALPRSEEAGNSPFLPQRRQQRR
jgi:membrane fusion protein, macrolide-specific efflux system